MEKKRPVAITVIAIIGFIGAILVIPVIFSEAAQSIGAWYPPYLGLSALIGLVCMVGLWMMKKWGVIVYALFVVINQIVLSLMGVWNIFALVIPAIVIIVGFSYFSRMD